VKKTIRIRIETHSVWMVRWHGSPLRMWCERCGAEVDFVRGRAAETPVTDAPLPVPRLRHYLWDAPGKALRLCLMSLRQLVEKNKGRES
jgi:hypothetical protein